MTDETKNPNAMSPNPLAYVWYPDPLEREIPADFKSAIGQALGAASSCWENLEEAGVFDSTRCERILRGLVSYLQSIETAKLSLATNEELLKELSQRMTWLGVSDYLPESYHGR